MSKIKFLSVVLFVMIILTTITEIQPRYVQADKEDGDVVIVTYPDESVGQPDDLILETTVKTDNKNNSETKEKITTENTTKLEKPIDKKIQKPVKAKINSVVRSAKNPTKAKIKIKKIKHVTGYQVKYSFNKKFKKPKIRTASNNNITLKKLKTKRKYYVKARAYVTYRKQKIWGNWSKVKIIKAKK